MTTLKDHESLAEFLEEAYKSKYAKYLEEDDNDKDFYDDEEDEPSDNSSDPPLIQRTQKPSSESWAVP